MVFHSPRVPGSLVNTATLLPCERSTPKDGSMHARTNGIECSAISEEGAILAVATLLKYIILAS